MRLRIFVDLDMSENALELLREGSLDHELLLPAEPAQSVLAQGSPDPLLATADVAFGQPDPAAVLDARTLKWVQVGSSGVTRYDTTEFRGHAARCGLMVTNSAQVYSEPCAQHALSFLLAQARNLPAALGQQTPGGSAKWDELRSSCASLEGQRLVIVGYGAIGRRLVELLQPLRMKIVAYRRRARGDENVPIITAENLASSLGEADHVMNILPLSEETEAFFDEERMAMMRPGGVFYNIGRGGTVSQDALLRGLRSRQVRAAWLDVTDPEPLPEDHPLLEEPRCHITPHVAGGHANEAQSLVQHFLRNLRRFERGDALVDRVM